MVARVRIGIKPQTLFGLIFVGITILLFLFKNWLSAHGVKVNVLLAGNAVLYLATFISFIFYRKSMDSGRAQYLVRMVYAGLLTKMSICLVAAVVYVLIAQHDVDKIALFGCFGFYFIYTFVEVRLLMTMSKDRKNA